MAVVVSFHLQWPSQSLGGDPQNVVCCERHFLISPADDDDDDDDDDDISSGIIPSLSLLLDFVAL